MKEKNNINQKMVKLENKKLWLSPSKIADLYDTTN